MDCRTISPAAAANPASSMAVEVGRLVKRMFIHPAKATSATKTVAKSYVVISASQERPCAAASGTNVTAESCPDDLRAAASAGRASAPTCLRFAD